MSDRLKLSDLNDDPEADEVAKELILKDQLDERIRELERGNTELRAQIAKEKQAQAAPKKSAANKIGARKEGSFKAISTAPSINKTPIGPSMVPVPYCTTQNLSSSIDTARTVNFNGCPAYVLDASTQPHCTGDEPGTGKGVKSGTVSGEVKPAQGSGTVRIEGKKVVRDGDACTMNGGNNPGIYITSIAASPAEPKYALRLSDPNLKTGKSKSYLAFQRWLRRTAFNVGEALYHPSDAIHGAAKGIPSHLLEALLKGSEEQLASELDDAAAFQTVLGNSQMAEKMRSVAMASRQVGAKLSLPKFRMRNAAEAGGDTVSTFVQIAAGGLGIIRSLARGIGTIKNTGPLLSQTEAGLIDDATVVTTTDASKFSMPARGNNGVRVVGRSTKIDAQTLGETKASEILAMPKGSRPSPETYLSDEYRAAHAEIFNDSVFRIQSEAPVGTIGRTETWVLLRVTTEDAILRAGGDIGKLEKLLGLDAGYLGKKPILVEIPNPIGYRIPTGNEFGANTHWKPGGFTSPGGLPEAIIDPVPAGAYKSSPVFP